VLKLVAVFEIVSGLAGLSLAVAGLIGMSSDVVAPMLWYGVFPLASVVAGVLLWRRLKLAMVLSILVQLLQVPLIRTDGFSLNLGAAMKLSISGIWCAGDDCRVMLVLGVNFLALAMLLILLWCRSDFQSAPTPDGGIEQSI
jgi:hypothetical protein